MPTRLSRQARNTNSATAVPGVSAEGSHSRRSATAMTTLDATTTAVLIAAPRTPKRRAAPSATTA